MSSGMLPSPRALLIIGAACSALAAVVGALGFPSESPDLREGVVPWVFALLVAAVGMIVWGTFSSGIGLPRRLAGFGSHLSIVGVLIATGFFVTIGSLNVLGTDLLSSDESLMATIGTVVASISCAVVLPVGLISFCVSVLADSRLSLVARCLPALGVLSGVLIFADDSLRTFVLLGGLFWAAFATVVVRR